MAIILDTCGLRCPLPVLYTQRKVNELSNSDNLKIIFDDPRAFADLSAWAKMHQHNILSGSKTAGWLLLQLQKHK